MKIRERYIVSLSRNVIPSNFLVIFKLVFVFCLVLCSFQSCSKSDKLAVVDKSEADYYIDSYLENMTKGSIAFNVPAPEMEIDQSMMVHLSVNLSKTPEQLEKELQNALFSTTERIKSYKIAIGSTMQASLSGSGFLIKAITPEVQLISAHKNTKWLWDIKAMESGEQFLYLTLSVLVTCDGKERSHALETFREKIIVRISPGKSFAAFIKKNWQWLCSVIIIPLLIWVCREKLSFKNKSKNK